MTDPAGNRLKIVESVPFCLCSWVLEGCCCWGQADCQTKSRTHWTTSHTDLDLMSLRGLQWRPRQVMRTAGLRMQSGSDLLRYCGCISCSASYQHSVIHQGSCCCCCWSTSCDSCSSAAAAAETDVDAVVAADAPSGPSPCSASRGWSGAGRVPCPAGQWS